MGINHRWKYHCKEFVIKNIQTKHTAQKKTSSRIILELGICISMPHEVFSCLVTKVMKTKSNISTIHTTI